jgi:hypothetical protein
MCGPQNEARFADRRGSSGNGLGISRAKSLCNRGAKYRAAPSAGEHMAMHNLDRTTLEMENFGEMHEAGLGHEHEHEAFEFNGESFENEGLGEAFSGEAFAGEFESYEALGAESPFSEAEVMELAAELLTISNEQELNHFLGGLVKRAWSGIRKVAASPLGKMVAGGLKSIARQALPMAGAALGNMVLPGVGGAIGSKLASGAGKLFGLELEGLSAEDREFEAAKQFVNLAGTAARSAAQMAQSGPPQTVARNALIQAARTYAPGLVPTLVGGPRAVPGNSLARGRARSGRWYRRGGNIIIVGA